MDKWPKRITAGIWDFGLAMIPVRGQKQYVTSMDYNMHIKKVSARDTINAYVNYFKRNYNGNRAPVHIGHHFSAYGGRMNNGDPKYWYVLKEFVKQVCHLPEVFCTSYDNLETFVRTAPASALKRFQKGKFNRGRKIVSSSTLETRQFAQHSLLSDIAPASFAAPLSTSSELAQKKLILSPFKSPEYQPERELSTKELEEAQKTRCHGHTH